MNADGAHILSIGTAVPGHRGTPAQALHFFSEVLRARASPADRRRLSRYLELLTTRSEIETRYTVIPDYLASDPSEFEFFPRQWSLEPIPSTARRMKVYQAESPALARRAAELALQKVRVNASEVTHLIVTSCTGFYAPGLDLSLVDSLSLTPRTARTLIGFMGCQAGFNAMRLADEIIRARPDSVVLQVSVELCTLHLSADPRPEALLANSLFGDGAAAVVYAASDRGPALARVSAQLCGLVPEARGQMTWQIGDHGFSMVLDAQVPRSLEPAARGLVAELLARAGHRRESVRRFAVHPGGPRVLDAAERALDLPVRSLQSARDVLRTHGNMSSASIFFVLERELADRRSAEPLIALGFGPGLSIEGAVLELVRAPRED